MSDKEKLESENNEITAPKKRGRKKAIKHNENLGTPKEDIIAFIDFLTEKKAAYANLRSMRAHLKVFLNGQHSWKMFDELQVKKFQTYLNEKVSMQTAYGYIKALHLAFEEAARKRFITQTPFDQIDEKDIEKPNQNDIERAYLSQKELQRLLQITPDLPFVQIRQLFLFACFTGLKWGDLVRLKWEDIVAKKYKGKKVEGFMYSSTYGAESLPEFIPFLDDAISILKERRAASENFDKEFVFEFLHEKDIDERSINRRFSRILKKYMLAMGVTENLNFHSARHTFALVAQQKGLDPYIISKLLGYKTLAMVSIYANLAEKEKIEAINHLSRTK